MAKSSVKDLLPSLDDLFSTQEERDDAKLETIQEIPLELIDDFPNHPFKVRMDEEMEKLIDSIKNYGVLVPALVRPKEDGRYQAIAGHRRKTASSLAEKAAMPCVIRNLTDEEATIIMVDSNLQRETVLPSEKAFAYKMKLEAMKRQGKRTDLTSCPVGAKLRSDEELASNAPDSARQIQRYIRLTNLIPELLELVDNTVLKEKDKPQMSLRPAVEISYLTEQEQFDLYETIQSEDRTPSHPQAIKMRELSSMGRLNMDVIFSIMQEEKPNQEIQVKIPHNRISKFFLPGTPVKTMEDTIVKALEEYHRKRSRDRER